MPEGADTSIAGLRGELTATAASLLSELEALGRIISDTRAQVTALRATDSAATFIPTATDELAAIVQHTAAATHEIIDTCEALESLAGRVPEAADVLQQATTRIYEACAFQDITGQRIAKVVAALQAIEARVGRVKEAVEMPAESASPSLLNGPQLPGTGVSQSDIDALFD
ncbi:protein phosphatase CheZ [Roseicella aquatilis]|nr:protein phosphatase CheZ [Roseicella aquatilis]